MIRTTDRLLVTALAAALLCGTSRVTSAELIETKLTASDAAANDLFGTTAAISGNTAIVGARSKSDAGHDAGAAYIFQWDGSSWTQQARLMPPDLGAWDRFGYSVDISGDTAIVGSYGDDDRGEDAGAAYIFQRTGTSWAQRAKLTASDAAADDVFGFSVGIFGDTAVVGVLGDDDNAQNSGSAYVFQRDDTHWTHHWTEQAKLTASDAATGDQFGGSIGIDGDTVIVGAGIWSKPGRDAAYIFQRDCTEWAQQAKLTASDVPPGNNFGNPVAISGDTAVVAAMEDYHAGNEPGLAYIFHSDGSSWTQEARLTGSDVALGDYFGFSVDIFGETAIVGALRHDHNAFDSGAVYTFTRHGSSWTQQMELTASDGAAGDLFGSSVGISGNTAVIGACWDDDGGSFSGSAYIYHPIPEPSSLVMLLGLGGACLLWYGRRRRNRTACPQGRLRSICRGLLIMPIKKAIRFRQDEHAEWVDLGPVRCRGADSVHVEKGGSLAIRKA